MDYTSLTARQALDAMIARAKRHDGKRRSVRVGQPGHTVPAIAVSCDPYQSEPTEHVSSSVFCKERRRKRKGSSSRSRRK